MDIQYLDNYNGYGKCIELTRGNIKLIATLDIGSRIIYYGNDFNFFYEDTDNLINMQGDFFDTNFKKGESWRIYGGHRLWKSPEDMASYAPDNYPVKLEVLDNSITLTSDIEKLTGIKKSINIAMQEDGSVKVTHRFTNHSDKSINVSLWALSVMDKNGILIAPLNTEDTGYLPNRNYVYWPYSDINDTRYRIYDNFFTVKQADMPPFKVGYLSPVGRLGYYLNGRMFIKKYDTDITLNHPDFNCNTEVYTNSLMLEAESISPLNLIEPAKSATHTEYWSIINTGEKAPAELYDILMK